MYWADKLISVLAPLTCYMCGFEGQAVCGRCLHAHRVLLPSTCFYCRRVTLDNQTCNYCERKGHLASVWAYSDYSGLVRHVHQWFKFRRCQSLAGVIAHAMSARLPPLSKQTMVVAVPTVAVRRRQRGFDHTGLLAHEIAQSLQLSVAKPLRRVGNGRQLGKSKVERQRLAGRSYELVRPNSVKGRTVLLVDDVATSGATLEVCARLLARAGARQVVAVVFARKRLGGAGHDHGALY